MHFITSPYKAIGLDISDLSVKAVEIGKRRGKKYIKAKAETKMPAGAIQGGEILNIEKAAKTISQLISKSKEKFSTHYVVASLPETKTFLKLIEIEKKEEMSIGETIKEELPKHIPAETSEMIIDWQVISEMRGKKTVFVVAVEKKIARDYAEVCRLSGLDVVAFEFESQAIDRAIIPWPKKKKALKKAKLKEKDSRKLKDKKNNSRGDLGSTPYLILDMGATRTSLIVADNKTIQFASSSEEVSGNKITEIIANKKKLSIEEAEKAKIICGTNPKKCKGVVKDIIEEAMKDIGTEIINTLEFYQTHFGKNTGDVEIILTSGGANMLGIDTIIGNQLNRAVRIANPIMNLEGETETDPRKYLTYTTAIGMALRNYSLGKI